MTDDQQAAILTCMYQYSRAIYRSIKDMIDPYVDRETQLEYRREVLAACEDMMERLAKDPLSFSKPARALFQDIRRYFPITCQAQVSWAVQEGLAAATAFIESQIEAGAFDGGGARCRRRRPRPSRASSPRCWTATIAPRTSASRPRRSRPGGFPRPRAVFHSHIHR